MPRFQKSLKSSVNLSGLYLPLIPPPWFSISQRNLTVVLANEKAKRQVEICLEQHRALGTVIQSTQYSQDQKQQKNAGTKGKIYVQ